MTLSAQSLFWVKSKPQVSKLIKSDPSCNISTVHYIILFLFSSVLYLNGLSADFAYDDSRAVQTNQDILPQTPWYRLFLNDFWGTPIRSSNSHGSYRPIVVFSFRLNYLLNGLDPFGFHFFNVALHLLVTLLYMKFISQVLNYRKRITLISSFLFASHPIHVESVTSIVGRADLGAALFYLLALLSYAKFVESEQRSNTKNRFLYASLVFAALSMFTKEHGVTCLAVCAVYHLFIIHRFFPFRWKNVTHLIREPNHSQLRRGLTALLICTIFLLTIRLMLTGSSPSFAPADNPASENSSVIVRFLTFLHLPVFNAWLLIYPRWLSFDWSMDSIPLVSCLADSRNLYTLLFYGFILTMLLKINNYLGSHRPSESKSQTSNCNKRCSKCDKHNSLSKYRHRNSFEDNNNNNSSLNYNFVDSNNSFSVSPFNTEDSSWLSEDNNNNDNGNPSYETVSAKINKNKIVLSRIDCLALSISMTVIPFLPATNLFFYVGFVVAERILYIPSFGFCLFIAVCIESFYKFCRHSNIFKSLIHISFAILVVSFSIRTVLRNLDWLTEENLYRSGIAINAPKAYGNLGNILSSQGKKEEAEWAYRKALEYRLNMADVHYNLGILLQEQKRYNEAVESYKNAIRFRPRLAVAHLNLGIVLGNLNQRDQAKRVYRYCADIDGTGLKDIKLHESARISALYNLGRILIDEGQYLEATETLKEAVTRMPHHYPAQSLFNLIGEVHYKLNQTTEAEKWFKKSLMVKGNHIPAHLTYAKMLAKQNRTSEAERMYLKALRYAPNDTLIYQHYGQLVFDSGQFSRALQLFEKAIELSPKNFDAIVSMANTLRELKKNKEAEKFYEKATLLRPKDVISHSNLGAIYHLNGKYKLAEGSYLQALRLKPDDPITNTNLAKLKQVWKSQNQ